MFSPVYVFICIKLDLNVINDSYEYKRIRSGDLRPQLAEHIRSTTAGGVVIGWAILV